MSRGEDWRSNSDTEVILRAWMRWGEAALPRLRGMFAFAIWDNLEKRLVLVRDRLGVKPLYYVQTGDGVAFASEIRALIAAGCAQRTLCADAVVSYLTYGSVKGPDTILAGVQMLPPGHFGKSDGRHLEIQSYWTIPSGCEEPMSFDGAVRLIAPVLEESVRLHLVSDVPLGIFLSGGVDSSAIAALASAASSSPVHTFTVTFDEEVYNEEKFAAEVASRYGCDHHQVHLSAARAASEIDAAVGSLDQPSADGVNTYFVAKAAKEAGLTVALSGLGGDEVFAGYSHFREFGRILKFGRIDSAVTPRLLRAYASMRNGSWDDRSIRVAELLEARGRKGRAYGVIRQMFGSANRKRLLDPDYAATASVTKINLPEPPDADPVNSMSILELSNYLRHTLLRDTDAMSMAHSLEVRVPFLDHRLIETAMRVPGKLKISGSGNKSLLVASVPNLPADVVHRPKMGFTLPMDAWFRDSLKPWLSERLSGDGLRGLPFLKPAAVGDLWQSFLAGGHAPSWSRVWSIAALAEWCEKNGVRA